MYKVKSSTWCHISPSCFRIFLPSAGFTPIAIQELAKSESELFNPDIGTFSAIALFALIFPIILSNVSSPLSLLLSACNLLSVRVLSPSLNGGVGCCHCNPVSLKSGDIPFPSRVLGIGISSYHSRFLFLFINYVGN